MEPQGPSRPQINLVTVGLQPQIQVKTETGRQTTNGRYTIPNTGSCMPDGSIQCIFVPHSNLQGPYTPPAAMTQPRKVQIGLLKAIESTELN